MFLWAELPGADQHEPVACRRRTGPPAHAGTPLRGGGLLERHLRLPFTLAPAQLEHAVEILAALTPEMAVGPAAGGLAYVA